MVRRSEPKQRAQRGGQGDAVGRLCKDGGPEARTKFGCAWEVKETLGTRLVVNSEVESMRKTSRPQPAGVGSAKEVASLF